MTERAGVSPMTPALSRALIELLDWQLWYFGQDIHHADGNALLAFGFERFRGPDDGTHRSTAYRLTSPQRLAAHGLTELTAWGFGITAVHRAYANPLRSLLLVRHERSPGLCTQTIDARAGTRDQLPDRDLPRCADEWTCLCTILAGVAGVCADYEQWAGRTLGRAHRLEAHGRRPREIRRRHELPAVLDEVWARFALRTSSSIVADVSPYGPPAFLPPSLDARTLELAR